MAFFNDDRGTDEGIKENKKKFERNVKNERCNKGGEIMERYNDNYSFTLQVLIKAKKEILKLREFASKDELKNLKKLNNNIQRLILKTLHQIQKELEE